MSNNVNIFSILTLVAILIVFIAQILALSTDYWSETEVLNSTITEHHGLIKQCICDPDCVCSTWDDRSATMKGSLAATCIGFIINFAVLGTWVSFMLNLGSDSVKRKYMIGFHISYSLMWISMLCAHIVFSSDDRKMMERMYAPQKIKHKLFWSWGLAILAQCLGSLLGLVAWPALRKSSNSCKINSPKQ